MSAHVKPIPAAKIEAPDKPKGTVLILQGQRVADASRRNLPETCALIGRSAVVLPDDINDALFAEAVAAGKPVEEIAAHKLIAVMRGKA
jgi:hypothetical protein